MNVSAVVGRTVMLLFHSANGLESRELRPIGSYLWAHSGESSRAGA